jgi:hypothetical protein
MRQPILFFESNPLFLVVCLIIAGLYTYLLYQKTTTWSKKQQSLLAAIRFSVVFLLVSLLLSPIIRQIENYFEKPVVVIAVDNSSSLTAVLDSVKLENIKKSIDSLHGQLLLKNYEIELRSFSGIHNSSAELEFIEQTTNINKLLSSIENDFENRNLAKVILFSDGIYNSGISPNFANYNFSLNAIGVGDTIPKKDLLIKELKYNKISYQGNQFPIIVEIENRGFMDESITISVYNNGEKLEQKVVALTAQESIETIEFLIDANKKGLQRFSITIDQKRNEYNTENNQAQAYIDIIDGKERILMIAASPHPDIKAIKGAIETNSNYDFNFFIPGMNKEPEGEYDLIIYHQFPDARGVLNAWFDKYKSTPYWIITTSKSNFKLLNEMIPTAQVQILGNETDAITASFNEAFSSFSISEDLKSMLREVPPLQVPFAKITTNTPVMLYQKLGSVVTQNPLLLLSEIDEVKSAMLFADGLWKWKLFEYAKNEEHTGFNELILKTVQYLSTRQDKRKFKFYPITKEINTSENLHFQTEAYNDLYEPIYDLNVDIRITDENNNSTDYAYITSTTNSRFSISELSEGVYTYTASTLINGKKENALGEFFVAKKNIEATNLTANFNLLKNIAKNAGGKFYDHNSIVNLIDDIVIDNDPEIIHSEESFQPIINLKWFFVIILLLISGEWFYRKYSGFY